MSVGFDVRTGICECGGGGRGSLHTLIMRYMQHVACALRTHVLFLVLSHCLD